MSIFQLTLNVLNSIRDQHTNFGSTYELASKVTESNKKLLEMHESLESSLIFHDHMEDDCDTDLNRLYLDVTRQFPIYNELSVLLEKKVDEDLKELYERASKELLKELDITDDWR